MSWVSGVSFVKGETTLLISSSNDGRLVVWHVGKQSSCLALGPPVVGELNTIHANGIFSMDQAVDGTIATVSKGSFVPDLNRRRRASEGEENQWPPFWSDQRTLILVSIP